jgi:glutathione reductase (NADPH)
MYHEGRKRIMDDRRRYVRPIRPDCDRRRQWWPGGRQARGRIWCRVVLVESGRLGGACVNVGCVPKKVMWNAADLAAGLHDAPEYGFRVTADGHDWPLMKKKRDAYVLRLNGIHESLLAKYKVELVRGHGRFWTPYSAGGGSPAAREAHHYRHRQRPLVPGIPGAELGITSDGFFDLEDRPRRVAVVGSGYIAIEVTGILAALGSKTTLSCEARAA